MALDGDVEVDDILILLYIVLFDTGDVGNHFLDVEPFFTAYGVLALGDEELLELHFLGEFGGHVDFLYLFLDFLFFGGDSLGSLLQNFDFLDLHVDVGDDTLVFLEEVVHVLYVHEGGVCGIPQATEGVCVFFLPPCQHEVAEDFVHGGFELELLALFEECVGWFG